MNEEKYKAGIQQKLLAQINLVLTGINYLNKNGSFTLISGKMGERPAPGSSGKAIMNAAVNSFVLSASLEMPKGMRLNVVSPSKISDIPDKDIVAAYLTCIETNVNGEIIRIGY
jgi:NAD(P)-dependent dehydrogenase (short-subunit alcohol dehydrogenase family)